MLMCNTTSRSVTDDTLLLLNELIRKSESITRLRTLLDVGCGDGHYHSFLSDCIEIIVGIDKDVKPRDPMTYKLSSRSVLLQQDITAIPYSIPENLPSKYDVILLLDVLEHIYAPHLLLSSLISQYSHEATRFFISVPNCRSLDDIVSNVNLSLFDPDLRQPTVGRWCEDHIRFFDYITFVKFLYKCSLEIETISGSNCLATPFCNRIASVFAEALNIPIEVTTRILGYALPELSPNICVWAKVKN